MRARVRKRVELPEICAFPGCTRDCAPGRPTCAPHFSELPAAEQVEYFRALEEALSAPNVQAARRSAKIRVGMILRGARA